MYGVIVYFLCALLSPDDLSHYEGYKEYFFSRRKWFFGAMAVMFVADLYDTYMKGLEHFHALGLTYHLRTGFVLLLSLLAIKVRNERFHAAFAVFTLLSEIFYSSGCSLLSLELCVWAQGFSGGRKPYCSRTEVTMPFSATSR